MFGSLLSTIGGGVVGLCAIQWMVAFVKTFLRSSIDLKKLGSWGIVTGATDGIGKALAMELASKGLNVVLISRTQSKLDQVKEQIEKSYPNVAVKTVQCDYSSFDQGARKKLGEELASIKDIAVLYNNVGASYDFPQYFTELSETNVDYLLKLNVESTTFMTHMILPGMLERKKGAIINMSSGSATLSAPLLAEYSASKRFVEQFTESLAPECISKGVHIQCHSPMFVATKLSKIRNASLFVPTPETYAKASVANIGLDTLCSPYWPHALQLYVYRRVPTFVLSKIALSLHLGLRKRALKKLEDKTK